ncbi:MAG: hypothetical protein KDC84_16020, partial [Crocinitomicaceae bacterium]|nr:hypothetical protein [Crocinitomicaceae bacterium]
MRFCYSVGLIILTLALFSLPTHGQLTNRTQFKDFSKNINFTFVEKDDPKMEYPRLQTSGEDAVVYIVQ